MFTIIGQFLYKIGLSRSVLVMVMLCSYKFEKFTPMSTVVWQFSQRIEAPLVFSYMDNIMFLQICEFNLPCFHEIEEVYSCM